MFDQWLRHVIIASYSFQEIRYHTWYKGELILHKYEPINPLKYQRTLEDLAPYPELPNPVTPTEPGTGSGTKPGNGSADLLNPSVPSDENEEWLMYETTDNNCVKERHYVKKKEDGNLDCIEYVIKDGESIMDIVDKYYNNIPDSTTQWALYNIIVRVNKDKRNIDLIRLTDRHVGGYHEFKNVNDLPPHKKQFAFREL